MMHRNESGIVPAPPLPPAAPMQPSSSDIEQAVPQPGERGFWSYWAEYVAKKLAMDLVSVKFWTAAALILGNIEVGLPHSSTQFGVEVLINLVGIAFILARAIVEASGNAATNPTMPLNPALMRQILAVVRTEIAQTRATSRIGDGR